MTIKPVLFCDLDGVLLDSESNLIWLIRSIKKTLSHFHIPLTDEHLANLHFQNIGAFKEVSKQLCIDPNVLWPIRNQYYTKEKLTAMKQRIINPFSDINVLYQLKNDFRLGIISNSPQSVVDFFVSEYGFTDLFSINIGRGSTMWDIEHLKPDIYLFTKAKSLIDTDQLFYIGDRETDRIFAQKAGMRYYHLNREKQQENSYSSLKEIVSVLQLSLIHI